jgi:hypothetical protein
VQIWLKKLCIWLVSGFYRPRIQISWVKKWNPKETRVGPRTLNGGSSRELGMIENETKGKEEKKRRKWVTFGQSRLVKVFNLLAKYCLSQLRRFRDTNLQSECSTFWLV